MPLADAMTGVKVFRSGGALQFDFSEASETARVVLSQARARAALEHAFGVIPDLGAPDFSAAGGDPDENPAPPVSAGTVLSTAAAISESIGADILMSKRIVSDDNDNGGIEDDQF